MEVKSEDKISRSKTFRKSVRDVLGMKRHREKEMPSERRKIDSRLSEYFRDYDNAASRISDEKIAQVRQIISNPADRVAFKDADIALALVSDYSNGNSEKAYDLLTMLERSEAGIIEPYSPDVKLAGAVNRNGVSCWLDSVLFAMFARSDDFDPMLFHTFTDPTKKRLVVMIRLWINLIRSGRLVTIGITAQIQDTLSDCGWPEAASRQQQDASEGFGRITEFLQLPPLTLKKDMFHQGKADQDDHKFTHERTIDLGIPPPREDGSPIKLEDCLENYFDETVSVSRQREEYARRNTVGSAWSKSIEAGEVKNKALHIEVAEVESSSPIALTPTSASLSYYDTRPQLSESNRKTSIFSEKKEDWVGTPQSIGRENSLPTSERKRSGQGSKQVSMRAFQFFRLIPWYTEGNPSTDLQVAQHFESKRPAVGICLKRFVAVDDSGTKWTKRKDFIDIPIESGIPSFLHDDDLGDEIFPNWKFKLSLQSAICHRGETLERGHYVSIVRVQRPRGSAPMLGSDNIPKDADPWVIHDDLASPNRVQYVDIEQALKKEIPYVLFYKIVLMEGDTKPGRVSFDGRPPSYSSSDSQSHAPSTLSPTGSTRPSQSGNATLSTAPSFTRTKSESSSVFSNTLGPSVQASLDHTGQAAATQPTEEKPAVQSTGTSKAGTPANSRPSSRNRIGDLQTVALAEKQAPSQRESAASERPVTMRSRHSATGRSGSVSRLSQIFKPRNSSREGLGRGIGSAERVSDTQTQAHVQAQTQAQMQALSAKDTTTQRAEENVTTDESRSTVRKDFRKSIDEMRSGRQKDKDREKERGSMWERGLGSKSRSRRSEPDRECSVM